ncbi:MAG: hypothetical protein GY869_22885, partial [Planctomycetes bacterium]|nr:hypothetical protein [Planctomycetota bacterium]
STEVADEFGARTCSTVFTGDNQAYLVDEHGNQIQELKTITTSATEYTTPESMPAILPPNSAFTYCAELSVAGAQRVKFKKPVITWVDNFLGFDVGIKVPSGYYDRDIGVWVPSDSGVVVRLLDTNTDGIVDALDSDGDNQPDDLDKNGLFNNEVIGLNDPQKYKPGSTYWRVKVNHFTSWDFNWNSSPPLKAAGPNPNGNPDADTCPDGDCKNKISSYVEDRGRIFHEDIPIPGTDINLHYSGSRVEGYKCKITVPASGETVPD